MSDKSLIQEYIDWCKDRGINQTAMGIMANRSRGWASLLVRNKITTLNFDTRTQIEKILGKSKSI